MLKLQVMFHTQEKRNVRLKMAEKCYKDNAWLGDAYYFWAEERDALLWGKRSKRATGYYEVYTAHIDCEDFLDTVFNQEEYQFWVRQIEKFVQQFDPKLGKPTIKELNRWVRKKNIWKDMDGILFQDLPTKEADLLIEKFYHYKRIQAAVFNRDVINNFAFFKEGKCL